MWESSGGCIDNINHLGLSIHYVAGNEYGPAITPGNEYIRLSVLSYDADAVYQPENSISLTGLEGELVTDQWYMITVTHDSATHTWFLYVNGALVSEITMTVPIGAGVQTCACNYAIGNRPNQYTHTKGSSFPGEIDELAFWDQVLTPAQILALYNQ